MLQKILPSYLYVQYNDDQNLRALVQAQNEYAQSYLDTMLALNLPNYTQDGVSGTLLNWVAEGLYGQMRPALSTVATQGYVGAYNTAPYATLAYNVYRLKVPNAFIAASDDTFRRCLTWVLYRGDGPQFSIRWLKRRVMRFLTGVNGTDPGVGETYRIGVSFGVGNAVTIRIIRTIRSVTGGSVYGRSAYNTWAYNTVQTVAFTYPGFASAEILQAAIDEGFLPLPFEYTYTVQLT